MDRRYYRSPAPAISVVVSAKCSMGRGSCAHKGKVISDNLVSLNAWVGTGSQMALKCQFLAMVTY